MEGAAQLTVISESNHPAASIRPVDTGQEGLVGDPFHRELGCLVVSNASESTVGTFDRRTFATNRTVNTGGKTQRGLIGDHPRSFSQTFAALPADLIVVEVSSSAARTKGHEGSLFLGNLLGSVGPGTWMGAVRRFTAGWTPVTSESRPGVAGHQTQGCVKIREITADVLVDQDPR